MEEECVSPFGFGEAKGDRVEEGGGYFQLRGKAGVEKDVMPMWVFLFPLSGGCFFFWLLRSSRPLLVHVDVGGPTKCQ